MMPAFIPPLLPSLRDVPPDGDHWAHEIKYDGYRVQIRIAGGEARFLTRRGFDWTHRFRDLPLAAHALPIRDAIIDGEVVVIRPDGVTSCDDLLLALNGDRSHALHFYAFDLLWRDGEDLRPLPLLARKERLAQFVGFSPEDPILYSHHMIGGGTDLLWHFCGLGLEGVVSKRTDAPYRSGRSEAWLKAKCTTFRPFVIGGFRLPEARAPGIGALLLGFHDLEGGLRFAGKVGTGWDARTSTLLRERLEAIRTEQTPFAGRDRPRTALWVRPELVCDVMYADWSPRDGLRHASFKGLREDVDPHEVIGLDQ